MSSRLRAAMEKYKSTGNNDFFTLKDDRDTAPVRFLYTENEDDLDWFVVHQAEIGGKKRWVQCPETSDCPFCREGIRPQLKLFIQLIDYRDNKVKTWERGQTFVGKLLSFMERYGALHKRKFEVERQGAKGDTQTKYELFPLDPDGETLESLAEQGFNRQVLLGERGFVLQRSIEDMQLMLDGTFQFEPVEGQREEPRRREQRSYQPPSTPTTGNVPPSQRQQQRQEQRRETPPPQDIF